MEQKIDLGFGILVIDWDIVYEAMGFLLKKALKEECPADTGDLKKSIDVEITNDKLHIVALEYAMYIEKGTIPHFVPIEPLKDWARRKLGDEKLAYAVRNHIAKYGTRPNEFIHRTIKNNMGKILKEALQTPRAVKLYSK
jgi:hypothetical protein